MQEKGDRKRNREEIRKLRSAPSSSTSGPSKVKKKFSEVLDTEKSENSFPVTDNF